MRDYDDELRSVAKIKKSADVTFQHKIDTGLKVLNAIYVLVGAIFAMSIWLAAIRIELTNEVRDRKQAIVDAREERDKIISTYRENRKEDRKLLSQLYLKIYGAEISFY